MKRHHFLFHLGYVVAILTLISLLLLSQATQGSQKFERFYQPLLLTIAVGVVCLLVIVIIYLFDLFRNYQQQLPGTSLSLTILWRTLLLAFIPLFFISFFAFKFLRYEFQSSFDEGINDALNNALVLSKKALDIRAVQALADSRSVSNEINNYDFLRLQTQLESVRQRAGAQELTVLDEKGFIQAFASADLTMVIPYIPEHSDFARVESEKGIFTLESDTANFQIRTLVTVDKPASPNYYLQSVFIIPDTVSDLTEQVNRTITERDKFNYLMPRVNRSFIFVLVLVVMLAGLLLMLSSIGFANDMAQPIRSLIQGTKRVSKGDFSQSLLIKRQDDFGTLMQSFNRMTYSLKTATEEADHNRKRVESERAYLATVINHMTAGVITLDYQYRLQTFNERAEMLLGISLDNAISTQLSNLDASLQTYQNLVSQVIQLYETEQKNNEIEVEIDNLGERKTLMASFTALPATDALHGGYVMIFDAMTEYLQQQKQAAWEEVARRLAHEIKNPLTPIQLAAERLNYKLANHLEEKEQKVLSRSIEVITKQVKSLKDMVNDFSDYAKPMTTEKHHIAFTQVLKDVFDLYRGHYSMIDFVLNINCQQDIVNSNTQVLKQVLHNVIKNAIEACESRTDERKQLQRGHILIDLNQEKQRLVLSVNDNGIGLPENGEVFEPYVTTKEKGTGLGLAIVKKIIQEHRGTVELKPKRDNDGTIAIITLPLIEPISITA